MISKQLDYEEKSTLNHSSSDSQWSPNQFQDFFGFSTAIESGTMVPQLDVHGSEFEVHNGEFSGSFCFDEAFIGSYRTNKFSSNGKTVFTLHGLCITLSFFLKSPQHQDSKIIGLELAQVGRDFHLFDSGREAVLPVTNQDRLARTVQDQRKDTFGWWVDGTTKASTIYWGELTTRQGERFTGKTGNATSPALLYDGPAIVSVPDNILGRGTEFVTCAVCEKQAGTRTVIGSIRWGYVVKRLSNGTLEAKWNILPTPNSGLEEFKVAANHWESLGRGLHGITDWGI